MLGPLLSGFLALKRSPRQQLHARSKSTIIWLIQRSGAISNVVLTARAFRDIGYPVPYGAAPRVKGDIECESQAG